MFLTVLIGIVHMSGLRFMPNLHKESRNAEIVRLFDGGRGLTHREIAERMGMGISAVSMAIKRCNDKIKKGEQK